MQGSDTRLVFRVLPGHCVSEPFNKLRVQGFGVWVADLRERDLGFRVQGSGLRDQGSGFRVQGSGYRVQDLGSRVSTSVVLLLNPKNQNS